MIPVKSGALAAITIALILGGEATGVCATTPWEILARNQNWRPNCEAIKKVLAKRIAGREFLDTVFSPVPKTVPEQKDVWVISLSGRFFPIPKAEYTVVRQPTSPTGIEEIQFREKRGKFGILISLAPRDAVDLVGAEAKLLNLSRAAMLEVATRNHLPKSMYTSQVEQLQFALRDVDCSSMELSPRALTAVLGKDETQKRVATKDSEEVVAYHLAKPMDAVLKIEKAFINDKVKKKTWIGTLKTESHDGTLYIEAGYYMSSREFIGGLAHLPTTQPQMSDLPKDIVDAVESLNRDLAKVK